MHAALVAHRSTVRNLILITPSTRATGEEFGTIVAPLTRGAGAQVIVSF